MSNEVLFLGLSILFGAGVFLILYIIGKCTIRIIEAFHQVIKMLIGGDDDQES